MASAEWTYSDWITYAPDDSSRLTRLRLHIKEVSDALRTGSYEVGDTSVDKDLIQDYHASLMDTLKSEEASAPSTTSKRTYWTRGKMGVY